MSTLTVLFNITLVVTPLIVLLLLFAPVLDKRYSAAGRSAMWMIVAAALCLPFIPSFIPAPVVLIDVQTPGLRPAQNEIITAVEPQSGEMTAMPGVPHASEISDNTAPSGGNFSLPNINWATVFWYGWVAGVLLSLVYYVVNHLIFLRVASRNRVAVTDEAVLQAFNAERARLGILSEIRLERCSAARAPMLVGMVSPSILLPNAEYDAGDLPLIIRHELTHYKRKDLWYKLALTFVKCVHWFNPAVRLMVRSANKDIETACDSLTINGMDMGTRKKYSEVILSMAAGHNLCRSQFTTCMNGGKNMLRKRFSNILDSGKRNGALVFVLLGAVLFASGILVGFNFSDETEYVSETQGSDAFESAIAESEAAPEVAASVDDANAGLEVSVGDGVTVDMNAGLGEKANAGLEVSVGEDVKIDLSAGFGSLINSALEAAADDGVKADEESGGLWINGEDMNLKGYGRIGKWYGTIVLDALTVSVSSADVEIIRNEDTTKETLTVESDKPFYIKNTGGVLSVIVPRTKAEETERQTVTVTVPAGKILDYVNAESGSGDILVQGITVDGGVTVTTTSGGTNLTDISSSEAIVINTASGRKDITGCEFETLVLNSASGASDLTLDENIGNYDVSFTTVTGSMTLNNEDVADNALRNEGADKTITITSVSGLVDITTQG